MPVAPVQPVRKPAPASDSRSNPGRFEKELAGRGGDAPRKDLKSNNPMADRAVDAQRSAESAADRLAERARQKKSLEPLKSVASQKSDVADETNNDFVTNLADCYGQSHPEEDFAETFAAILNPDRSLQKEYKDQIVALKKISWIQKQIKINADKSPKVSTQPQIYKATRMRRTLGKYYQDRLPRSRQKLH